MKATINVSLRIPTTQAQIMRRAAEAQGVKLATFIRTAAIIAARQWESARNADHRVMRAAQ